jgi:hypothetical protein
VEFKKSPVEIQDFRETTYQFRFFKNNPQLNEEKLKDVNM